MAAQRMRRRRFLPFFPFPKPLALLDIPDPRCFSPVATGESATPTEKFPRSGRLDDREQYWSQLARGIFSGYSRESPEQGSVRELKNSGSAKRSEPRNAYRETLRRRRAVAMTETELKLIAALASMGLSNQPKMG